MRRLFDPSSASGTSSTRLLLISVCALAGLLLFGACGKKETKHTPRPLSESASLLVNPPAESTDAVLLHTVDSATEFPVALSSLQPDVPKPEVRVIQETPPEPVPQGPDTAKPLVEVVQPVKASVPLKEDWGGVILVPDISRMSRGFTSRVTLTRIEAHPLEDDHFRVWVRIRNDSGKGIDADVACNFRALNQVQQATEFIPIKIAAGGSANAYFISPMPHVAYYTILVR